MLGTTWRGDGRCRRRALWLALLLPALAPPHALAEAAAAATAVAAPSDAPAPAVEQKVSPEQVVAVLGLSVMGPDGKEEVGRLVDVLVNAQGEPVAAVIDVGGFLGVGNRLVAVAWKSLHFAPGGKTSTLTLELDPAVVKAAPEYKPTKPATVVAPPSSSPSGSSPGPAGAAPAASATAQSVPAAPATPGAVGQPAATRPGSSGSPPAPAAAQ
jgi:hypothetical protein